MSWAPMHTFLCRQCQAWGSSSGAQIDGSNYGGLTPVPTSTSLPLNNLRVFFKFLVYLFIHGCTVFVAARALFLSCSGGGGYSLGVVQGLFTAVASLVAEHRL